MQYPTFTRRKSPRAYGVVTSSVRRSLPRHAVATVELAVCLPLLVLLVFGSMQACDTIYLQHVTTIASYEGTLAASKSGATRTEVIDRANAVLDEMGIKGALVGIDPNVEDLSSIQEGTLITVIVTAGVAKNLNGPTMFTPRSEVQTRGVTIR